MIQCYNSIFIEILAVSQNTQLALQGQICVHVLTRCSKAQLIPSPINILRCLVSKIKQKRFQEFPSSCFLIFNFSKAFSRLFVRSSYLLHAEHDVWKFTKSQMYTILLQFVGHGLPVGSQESNVVWPQ